MQSFRPLALFALTGAVLTSFGHAQDSFAPPVQIKAGKKLLGKGRMYPSPGFHDINGDGLKDVFIGDLRGHITYALRKQDGTFDNEQKLKNARGRIIDFGNW